MCVFRMIYQKRNSGKLNLNFFYSYIYHSLVFDCFLFGLFIHSMSDKPEEMIAPRKSHYPNKKYLDYISRRSNIYKRKTRRSIKTHILTLHIDAPSEVRKNIYNLAHLKPASNLGRLSNPLYIYSA